MTPRCGYYIADGKVVQKTVYIDWSCGFTREAKYQYIVELHDDLQAELGDLSILEVTSASPFDYGRALSPIFLKINDKESLEDYWKDCTHDGRICYFGYEMPEALRREAFIHAYCLSALRYIPMLQAADVFTDVFHNPKTKIVTQAEACAVLKLMSERNELECLSTIASFLGWYTEHGRRV